MGKGRKTAFYFYVFSELASASTEKNKTSQLVVRGHCCWILTAEYLATYRTQNMVVVYAPYAAARYDPWCTI